MRLSRRDFLKLAGPVGLSFAGVGAALTTASYAQPTDGGCSPGYWKNNPEDIGNQLENLYDNFDCWDGMSVEQLQQVLNNTSTMEAKLERQTLAAALSVCAGYLHPDIEHRFTGEYDGQTFDETHTVRVWINLGLAQLDGENNWRDEAYKDGIELTSETYCGVSPTPTPTPDDGPTSARLISYNARSSNGRSDHSPHLNILPLVSIPTLVACLLYLRTRQQNR